MSPGGNGAGREHERPGSDPMAALHAASVAGKDEVRSEGRTLGQLLRELSHEASALVRAEAALARSELGDTVGEAKKSATSVAIGGAVVVGGFLTLLACLVLGLAQTMPAWLAALIVGGGTTLIGTALLLMGREQLKHQDLGLPRTRASLRGTQQLAREVP